MTWKSFYIEKVYFERILYLFYIEETFYIYFEKVVDSLRFTFFVLFWKSSILTRESLYWESRLKTIISLLYY